MASEGLDRVRSETIRKIRQRIGEIGGWIWTEGVAVEDVAISETMDHLSIEAARRLRYRRAHDGHEWGSPWSTAWFRLRLRIPATFRGETVSLKFRPNGESLIYRDGVPVQGLDPNRDDYQLVTRAKGGERIELYIESGCNERLAVPKRRRMETPQVTVFNREVWDAWHSLGAFADMLQETHMDFLGNVYPIAEKEDTRRARIIFTLNQAVDAFDYQDISRKGLRNSASKALRVLAPLRRKPAVPSAQTIAAMGHAHIDVAWLWPLSETVRKCGRTFSNVLALMDEYPEFQFVQSQPHLYEFTRERYPSLFRRIKAKARTGQWIPTGAMWIEADCNVTSGESLVRQILHGMRYFKKEFGYNVRCLWLPDVFGYSGALPQILRGFGIPYFLTQKISWNRYTTFPYHSFHWEGIDGSSVLAHFPPVATYNSLLNAPEIRFAERRYFQKDRSSIQMIPFGFGDGGGGPTKGHLERLRRYRNLEGMPKLEPMAPEEFFDRLSQESGNFPRWVGELYLELHRGTLTTQGRNKRFNRRCELALRDLEWISACGLAAGGRYEQAAINRAWKTVLLNQFHDIIPGSSIREVYEDSTRDYTATLRDLEQLSVRASTGYAARVDTRGEGVPVLVNNALSWERRGVVAIDPPAGLRRGALVATLPDGTSTPVQRGADGKLRFAATVPSMGHSVCHLTAGKVSGAGELKVTRSGLENARLRVRLDAAGRVRRIWDKHAARDVLAPRGIGNQLVLFEDKPVEWEAWDIDQFYRDKPLIVDGALESIDVVESGPVRGVVRIVRRLSKSRVIQDLVLEAGSARIDFVTRVEWGDEAHVLLKVAFPVNVHAERARYEIQYGSLERPTHTNMPQDFARFEVAGQKWADLSEPGFGVAMLNDCKYGHDIRGNVMSLSLLRATKEPDATADINQTHEMTFSIYPHAGDFTQGVVREGYVLNVPLSGRSVANHAGKLPAAFSGLALSAANVVIDCVKQAEDERSLIVRMYECHGARGSCDLTVNLPARAVWETDLMEKPVRRLRLQGRRVRLAFGPFQIRTVKLVL